MTKETLKERIEKNWPRTKKELEKALKSTKKMLIKGEKYLVEASEKGAKEAKKLALNLKKEKLYLELGKAAAFTSVGRWKMSKKINALLKKIKDLDKQVKSIK